MVNVDWKLGDRRFPKIRIADDHDCCLAIKRNTIERPLSDILTIRTNNLYLSLEEKKINNNEKKKNFRKRFFQENDYLFVYLYKIEKRVKF